MKLENENMLLNVLVILGKETSLCTHTVDMFKKMLALTI
jgi:hypothetical protein